MKAEMETSASDYITIPLRAFFAVPFIQQWLGRVICDGKDVTPEPDHAANRRACKMANQQNADVATRLKVPEMPYFHYDALRGEALELTAQTGHGR